MITLDLAERLIHTSRPPRGFFHGSRMALLGLGLLIGVFLARPGLLGRSGIPAWLWPHLFLLVILAMVVWQSLRQRRQSRLMLETFESLQLREWERARGAVIPLLSRPVRHPQARVEVLLGLAALAEVDRNYDVAQRICESIVEEAAGNPVQLFMARTSLAAVMLRNGQVADAVDLISRLDRADLPESLRAHVELLSLYREVNMGQQGSAVEKAEHRRRLFRRHLSTRAGYGYGLLAAAFDLANQRETARRYWEDATLLIRPTELLERFDELKPVAARYAATERPL